MSRFHLHDAAPKSIYISASLATFSLCNFPIACPVRLKISWSRCAKIARMGPNAKLNLVRVFCIELVEMRRIQVRAELARLRV